MSILIATITAGKIRAESFRSVTNQTHKDTRIMLLMEDSHVILDNPLQNKIENITRARNQVRSMALSTDCTHVWWVDSDIVPPDNGLELMLKADSDVVCGWFPPACGDGVWPHGWIKDGVYCYADKVMDGVVPVDFSGFGCVLTNRKSLESVEFRFPASNIETSVGPRLASEATAWTSDVKGLGFNVVMHGDVVCDHMA